MPNPRFITSNGEPTVELLMRLSKVKDTYLGNLDIFCKKYFLDKNNFEEIQNIFLIGSHANNSGWKNDTSDVDFKIVNPFVIPEFLWKYKKETLDPKLCTGKKEDGMIFFLLEKNIKSYFLDGN